MDPKQNIAIFFRQICPVHGLHTNQKTGIDRINAKCCCDFFRRKYVTQIEDKLTGKTVEDTLDAWEIDLLMNELQAADYGVGDTTTNTLLTIKNRVE